MTLKSIKEYEGCRLYPYKDSLGYLTIGYGHLILPNEKFPIGRAITLEKAEELFQKDLANVIKDLDSCLPFWRELDEVAQEIMRNLSFNLGIRKLMKFTNTLRAMKEHRYKDAGDCLIKSLWYKQVGRRSKDIVYTLHELGNRNEV